LSICFIFWSSTQFLFSEKSNRSIVCILGLFHLQHGYFLVLWLVCRILLPLQWTPQTYYQRSYFNRATLYVPCERHSNSTDIVLNVYWNKQLFLRLDC
jgi:hypothetical protein